MFRTQGEMHQAKMIVGDNDWDGFFHYVEDLTNEENAPFYYFVSESIHGVSRTIIGNAETFSEAVKLANDNGITIIKGEEK